MIAYVDSSVLLRFILQQPEPLTALVGSHERLTSVLTEVECMRAIERARLAGGLNEEESVARRAVAHAQLRRTRRLPVSLGVVRRAGGWYPSPLKALDALHIATALAWRDHQAPDLVFATHDRQQARAALALGFEVIGV